MNTPAANTRTIRWIMAAIFVWGAVLALGAGLFGYDPAAARVQFAPQPLRGLIVFGFVLAFLGGWSLLLRSKR